jgi:Pvc16 N-terminal domain/Carboxypeptidase regulatory-like domain
MLISVLQTLAEILAGGTSLTNTEQIDFSRPGSRRDEGAGPLLNLYLYDIRESKQVQHSGRQVERKSGDSRLQTAKVGWSPDWFDVSLLITAWDRTALGEYHLLTEAMSVLLRHRSLQEDYVAPELRGYGNLSLSVSIAPPIELGALWSALSLPLRPALYLTTSIPFSAENALKPRVWERIVNLHHGSEVTFETARGNSPQLLTRRVSVAGVIRDATTDQILVNAKVMILNTEKQMVTNAEGLFFFEELSNGNYVLNVQHPGYRSGNSNVLVEAAQATFKEILLIPGQQGESLND